MTKDSVTGVRRGHGGKGAGTGLSGAAAAGGGAGSAGGGPKFHAIIVGEPIVAGVADRLGYPLSPISPSPQLPYALLPICNTPIIDYILENLVENGVNEVTIMLNAESVDKVCEHLSQSRTARGKPWLSSDAITVSLLRCDRNITKLAEVSSEIRERNVVAQSGSFLLVPIDCLAFFGNLRECYHTHLERRRTVGKYAATLLCTRARERLDATLHNVLARHVAEREEGGGGGRHHHHREHGRGGAIANAREDKDSEGGHGSGGAGDYEPGSPLSEHSAIGLTADDELRLAPYAKGRHYAVATQPAEHHTMFVIDKATSVVRQMLRLEATEEPPEPPTIAFSRKEQLSVRMDLAPTGFLFLSSEALPLIDFYVRDIWGFLSSSLLAQVEVFGNVFGVLEVPRRCAIIDPVSSLDSYLQANIDICARRFFPLTRDSCFAEALARYAVASNCETVYYHTTAKVQGGAQQQQIGPNVVIGENVQVPSSTRLAGVVVGSNVQLGEHTSLTSCVVMDGAMVGRHCNVQGSVIGYNAVIGDGADVSGCLIGAGCVVFGPATTAVSAAAAAAAALGDREGSKAPSAEDTSASHGSTRTATPTPAGGLVLHNQAVVYEQPDGSEEDEASSSSSSSSPSSSLNRDDDEHGHGHGHGHQRGDTDHWLVGPNGLGRGLVERYSSSIRPTAALFTEDPVPGKAGGGSSGSDEDDSDSASEDDPDWAFRQAIRRSVEAALQQPSNMHAYCYDMSTACLAHQRGFPQLCEAVTEMLMEHLLSRNSDKGADACLAAAEELFGQWGRSFYDSFLYRNGTELVDGMVSTLEGMAAAIHSPSCVLHGRAAELLEVLYANCDEDLYDERGFCVVSARGMVAFDAAMARREQNLIRFAGFGRPASSDSSSSDDDDDADEDDEKSSVLSRDLVEEGKVAVARLCRPYITGVQKYLEEIGEW